MIEQPQLRQQLQLLAASTPERCSAILPSGVVNYVLDTHVCFLGATVLTMCRAVHLISDNAQRHHHHHHHHCFHSPPSPSLSTSSPTPGAHSPLESPTPLPAPAYSPAASSRSPLPAPLHPPASSPRSPHSAPMHPPSAPSRLPLPAPSASPSRSPLVVPLRMPSSPSPLPCARSTPTLPPSSSSRSSFPSPMPSTGDNDFYDSGFIEVSTPMVYIPPRPQPILCGSGATPSSSTHTSETADSMADADVIIHHHGSSSSSRSHRQLNHHPSSTSSTAATPSRLSGVAAATQQQLPHLNHSSSSSSPSASSHDRGRRSLSGNMAAPSPSAPLASSPHGGYRLSGVVSSPPHVRTFVPEDLSMTQPLNENAQAVLDTALAAVLITANQPGSPGLPYPGFNTGSAMTYNPSFPPIFGRHVPSSPLGGANASSPGGGMSSPHRSMTPMPYGAAAAGGLGGGGSGRGSPPPRPQSAFAGAGHLGNPSAHHSGYLARLGAMLTGRIPSGSVTPPLRPATTPPVITPNSDPVTIHNHVRFLEHLVHQQQQAQQLQQQQHRRAASSPAPNLGGPIGGGDGGVGVLGMSIASDIGGSAKKPKRGKTKQKKRQPQSEKKKTRKFPCSICHKLYSTRGNLHTHMKIHREQKQFQCEYCPKSFVQKHNLVTHTRTHTGEKPFHCDHPGCNQRFARLNNLQRHWNSHNGRKPHFCNVPGCGRKFANRFNLKNHMKLHATKMPKFTCKICKDSFDTNDELNKHLNDHAEADRLDHLKGQQAAAAAGHRQQPKLEPGLKSEASESSSSSSSASKVLKKATADAISSFAESVLANDDDDDIKSPHSSSSTTSGNAPKQATSSSAPTIDSRRQEQLPSLDADEDGTPMDMADTGVMPTRQQPVEVQGSIVFSDSTVASSFGPSELPRSRSQSSTTGAPFALHPTPRKRKAAPTELSGDLPHAAIDADGGAADDAHIKPATTHSTRKRSRDDDAASQRQQQKQQQEDEDDGSFPLLHGVAQAAPSTPLMAVHQQNAHDNDRNPIIGRVVVPPMTHAQAQLIKQEGVPQHVDGSNNLSLSASLLSDLNNPITSLRNLTGAVGEDEHVSETGFLRTRHQRSRSGTQSRSRSRSQSRRQHSYNTRSRADTHFGGNAGTSASLSGVHRGPSGDQSWGSMSIQGESQSHIFRGSRSGRASVPPPTEHNNSFNDPQHQHHAVNQHNARAFDLPDPTQPQAAVDGDGDLPRHRHKRHRRIQSMPLPRNEMLGDADVEQSRMLNSMTMLPSRSPSPESSHDETNGETLRDSEPRVKSEPRDAQSSSLGSWIGAQSVSPVNSMPVYEIVDTEDDGDADGDGDGDSVATQRRVHAPRLSHRKRGPALPRSISQSLFMADDTRTAVDAAGRFRSNSARQSERGRGAKVADSVTLAPIRHRGPGMIAGGHGLDAPVFQDLQRFVPVAHTRPTQFGLETAYVQQGTQSSGHFPSIGTESNSSCLQGDDFVAAFLSSPLDAEKVSQHSISAYPPASREDTGAGAGTVGRVANSSAHSGGHRADHDQELSKLLKTADSFLKRSPTEPSRNKAADSPAAAAAAAATSPTLTVRESLSPPPKRMSLHSLKRPPVSRGLRGGSVGRSFASITDFTTRQRAVTSPTGRISPSTALPGLINRMHINRMASSPSPARTVSASLSPEHRPRRGRSVTVALSPRQMDSVYRRTRSRHRRGSSATPTLPSAARSTSGGGGHSHRRVKSHTGVAARMAVSINAEQQPRSASPTPPRVVLSGELYKGVGPYLGSEGSDTSAAAAKNSVASRARSASQYSPYAPGSAAQEAGTTLPPAAYAGINKASRSLSAPGRNETGGSPPAGTGPLATTSLGFMDTSPFSPTFAGLNTSNTSPQMTDFMRTPPSALGAMHRQQPPSTHDAAFSHSGITSSLSSDGIFSPSFTPRESSLSNATHTSVGSLSSTDVESDNLLSSPSSLPAASPRNRSFSAHATAAPTHSRARSVSNSSTNTVIVPPSQQRQHAHARTASSPPAISAYFGIAATGTGTGVSLHSTRANVSSPAPSATYASTTRPRVLSGDISVAPLLDEVVTDHELTPTTATATATGVGGGNSPKRVVCGDNAKGTPNSGATKRASIQSPRPPPAQADDARASVASTSKGGASAQQPPVVMSSAEEILETTPIPNSFASEFS